MIFGTREAELPGPQMVKMGNMDLVKLVALKPMVPNECLARKGPTIQVWGVSTLYSSLYRPYHTEGQASRADEKAILQAGK